MSFPVSPCLGAGSLVCTSAMSLWQSSHRSSSVCHAPCSSPTCSHGSQVSVLLCGGTSFPVHMTACFCIATWGLCSPVTLHLCPSAAMGTGPVMPFFWPAMSSAKTWLPGHSCQRLPCSSAAMSCPVQVCDVPGLDSPAGTHAIRKCQSMLSQAHLVLCLLCPKCYHVLAQAPLFTCL